MFSNQMPPPARADPVSDDIFRPDQRKQKERDRLAAGPTRSYAGTKRQLNNWLYTRMDEQLELEADVQQEMAGSDDFVEGVMAFVNKRAATFGGS